VKQAPARDANAGLDVSRTAHLWLPIFSLAVHRLDQYKEKKPKDPMIRARFDTYRFGDHKEMVIDLLARVTTVSVETMRIVDTMRDAQR
jgi:hypothetical protein